MNIVCITFSSNEIRRIGLQNNGLKLNDHECIPPIDNFISINVVPPFFHRSTFLFFFFFAFLLFYYSINDVYCLLQRRTFDVKDRFNQERRATRVTREKIPFPTVKLVIRGRKKSLSLRFRGNVPSTSTIALRLLLS